MRKIGIVSVARSDYGIYRPVLDALKQAPNIDYGLFVSGAHLLTANAASLGEIEGEGHPIWSRIPVLDRGDDALSIAKAIGTGVTGFAQAYDMINPDILLVLGDRFDMFAAVVAAVPLNIPIAHIHGGEVSYGAIDEVFRHAITKMSHLHFPATEDYARRLRQLGEEAWRVTVSGAPSLDSIRTDNLVSAETLSEKFGFPFNPAPVIVTLHGTTRSMNDGLQECEAMLSALQYIKDRAIIFTASNADTGGQQIMSAVQSFIENRANAYYIESFGSVYYLSALSNAAVLVGNSSSGLIETPSFKLPVVNIGDRQAGRKRARNVIDVEPERHQIEKALKTALSAEFRDSLADLENPYGDGNAAKRIVEVLQSVKLDEYLIAKRFTDL